MRGGQRPIWRRFGVGPKADSQSAAWPCMDAPFDASETLDRYGCNRVRSCIRPSMRQDHAAGPYGIRGSGPYHWSALEALPMRLVLPIPSHRRCAIPLSFAPLTSSTTSHPWLASPMRPRPELDKSHLWLSAPRQCALSCSPMPRSPAWVACGRASSQARNHLACLCASSTGRPPNRL